jgi:hypothetical protein
MISGWKESYLNNSNHPLACGMPDDTPAVALMTTVATSVGDPAMVPSSSLWSAVAPQGTLVLEESVLEALEALMSLVHEVSGTNGASLGADGIEVDGVGPRPSDDIGGSLGDLVMQGTDLGMPRSTTPSDVIPAPGSSGAVSPRVVGLLLPGLPGFPP